MRVRYVLAGAARCALSCRGSVLCFDDQGVALVDANNSTFGRLASWPNAEDKRPSRVVVGDGRSRLALQIPSGSSEPDAIAVIDLLHGDAGSGKSLDSLVQMCGN